MQTNCTQTKLNLPQMSTKQTAVNEVASVFFDASCAICRRSVAHQTITNKQLLCQSLNCVKFRIFNQQLQHQIISGEVVVINRLIKKCKLINHELTTL